MNEIRKSSPWLNRGLLIFATGGYALLGSKYLSDPVKASAADHISLGSPAGITDMRVVGALFLACGVITLSSLLSNKRHLDGLRFVFTVLTSVTLARAYGFFVDGTAPATILKLRNEVVLVAVFGAGIAFELFRQRRGGTGPQSASSFQIAQGESHEVATH